MQFWKTAGWSAWWYHNGGRIVGGVFIAAGIAFVGFLFWATVENGVHTEKEKRIQSREETIEFLSEMNVKMADEIEDLRTELKAVNRTRELYETLFTEMKKTGELKKKDRTY